MASFQETKFRQDMPPEGGYAKLYVQRTFPRIGSKIGKRFALVCALGFCGSWFKYRASKKRHYLWMLELNDVRMVTKTFLDAERDRRWLNYLRELREEERNLMKDVPGWRVGTWYGEPIYYTLDPDQWWDPYMVEVQAHSSYYNQRKHETWRVDSDMRGGPHWYDKYLPDWLACL